MRTAGRFWQRICMIPHGNIYKASFQNFTQSYDLGWPYSYTYMHFNLTKRSVGTRLVYTEKKADVI